MLENAHYRHRQDGTSFCSSVVNATNMQMSTNTITQTDVIKIILESSVNQYRVKHKLLTDIQYKVNLEKTKLSCPMTDTDLQCGRQWTDLVHWRRLHHNLALWSGTFWYFLATYYDEVLHIGTSSRSSLRYYFLLWSGTFWHLLMIQNSPLFNTLKWYVWCTKYFEVVRCPSWRRLPLKPRAVSVNPIGKIHPLTDCPVLYDVCLDRSEPGRRGRSISGW